MRPQWPRGNASERALKKDSSAVVRPIGAGSDTNRHSSQWYYSGAPASRQEDTAWQVLAYPLAKAWGRWLDVPKHHDATGRLIGVLARWDCEQNGERRKPILPLRPGKRGCELGGMPAPRPLYQLPRILQAWAADDVGIALMATTSPHERKLSRPMPQ